MTSVKRDIEAIEGNRHVRSALDTVSIYAISSMSDSTKNVLSSRGIFFVSHPSYSMTRVVMSDTDRDWLLDTLKMLVEEE
jgi:hypothetical protein